LHLFGIPSNRWWPLVNTEQQINCYQASVSIPSNTRWASVFGGPFGFMAEGWNGGGADGRSRGGRGGGYEDGSSPWTRVEIVERAAEMATPANGVQVY
jgi:hypothetical protein